MKMGHSTYHNNPWFALNEYGTTQYCVYTRLLLMAWLQHVMLCKVYEPEDLVTFSQRIKMKKICNVYKIVKFIHIMSQNRLLIDNR